MSLVHAEEAWVAIFTRDTAGWAALHPLARFVSLELTRKLNRHGELSVGVYGLPALAALLHAPWELLEEHVCRLIADGRLEYDEERRVVRDPQHASRQAAAHRTEAPRTSARRLSMTREAVRARERRATSRQLDLEGTTRAPVVTRTPPVATTVATGTTAVDRTPSEESQAITQRSARPRTERLAPTEISLSLSDLKISKKSERGELVPRDAPLSAEHRAAFEAACTAAGATLCAYFVWRKFAAYAAKKRWREGDVTDRWTTWFEREIEYTRARGSEPRTREQATSAAGPGLAAGSRIVAQHAAWEREARAASREETLAASRRAMAVFA